jgi:hypothetical protein
LPDFTRGYTVGFSGIVQVLKTRYLGQLNWGGDAIYNLSFYAFGKEARISIWNLKKFATASLNEYPYWQPSTDNC